METKDTRVVLLGDQVYKKAILKTSIDQTFKALSFQITAGSTVLLKPNLVAATGHDGLACTHPTFLAALAEWLLDHRAIVKIGDSPAFGNAKKIMNSCGIIDALKNLPVELLHFTPGHKTRLATGFSITVAEQLAECEVLINLPKLKAHNQLLVSMAVKNIFGIVTGLQKPLLHMHYGDRQNNFAKLIIDLLELLPSGLTLVDGITAMHKSGPVDGSANHLGIIAAGLNPIAIDTALLRTLSITPSDSPLWAECNARRLPGCSLDELSFPFETPDDLSTNTFLVPKKLQPIRFNPFHIMASALRRIFKNE